MTAIMGQRWDKGTAPIDWAKCGTEANHRRHLRLGEKPCAACLQAHAHNRKRAR